MAVSASSLPCFLSRKTKRTIIIEALDEGAWPTRLKTLPKAVQAGIADCGFTGKAGQVYALTDAKSGVVTTVLAGVNKPERFYDFSVIATKLSSILSGTVIRDSCFVVEGAGDPAQACIGWGLACYKFDRYRTDASPLPRLVLPAGIDKARVRAMVEAVHLIRDLVNTPANDLGPAELEQAARDLAAGFDATVKVLGDKALAKDFPLVFAVGDSSPRRPRLIDLQWGNPKHPKVTLVGKGVCFDTGGLDLKPSSYMALMKKDMGGAAHVLGLARLIMGTNLPVRLRVLIPAVENSVSGTSFRPGDVFKSRKGLMVENTNTDAEGRLILADALTYGSEEKPDLLIDFATLTGSARAALGPDIPAVFSNSDDLAAQLREASFAAEDPVWPMPLWRPYRKTIESSTGDLVNSASTPGDLIYSALFLESFLAVAVNWIHLDCFAWENAGKAGRPKGGADTGMRAVFALLEARYGKNRKKSSSRGA